VIPFLLESTELPNSSTCLLGRFYNQTNIIIVCEKLECFYILYTGIMYANILSMLFVLLEEHENIDIFSDCFYL